jgi:hypothetical protein
VCPGSVASSAQPASLQRHTCSSRDSSSIQKEEFAGECFQKNASNAQPASMQRHTQQQRQ